jgi:hypothetical protein
MAVEEEESGKALNEILSQKKAFMEALKIEDM